MADQLSIIPPELKNLYDIIYLEINSMIGDKIVDLRTDSTTLKILIQSTITVVGEFRDADEKGLYVTEKKRITLLLIQYIIHDLAVNGKISTTDATNVKDNMHFIDIAIDISVDATNLWFDIGRNFRHKKPSRAVSFRKNFCFGF